MAQDKEEVEIDLLELGKNLWNNKRFIIKCSVIGAVVGVIIAFSIPKEYTTTVILTTESGKSAGGNMGALASMAGINLGGATGVDLFSPELYPNVLNSTPFVQGLLNINVSDPKQKINTSLYNYMKDEQKVPWWTYIFKAPGVVLNLFKFTDEDLDPALNNKYFISKDEMEIIDALKQSYSINTEKKTGVTTLNITVQSSQISAYLADTLTAYLQTYIIDQRTKKAKTDLINSENLYSKAREDYYKVQQNLASFADANKNITSAKYQINQDRLQNESDLAYSLYNQMAQQVQMNKIKIQDNTPVFIVIQPSVESLFPAKPRKGIILSALILLTFIGACGWIIGKDYYNTLNKQ